MRHDTAVTKQCTAKWPYIANAVFRIVQNNGEFSYFGRFQGWQSSPLDTPIVLNTRMLSEVPRTLGCRLSKYFVKRQLWSDKQSVSKWNSHFRSFNCTYLRLSCF